MEPTKHHNHAYQKPLHIKKVACSEGVVVLSLHHVECASEDCGLLQVPSPWKVTMLGIADLLNSPGLRTTVAQPVPQKSSLWLLVM